jgi:hypothetical protein
MKRTFRTSTLGLAAMAAVLMASLLTASQPAQAQVPTPRQCSRSIPTPQAWDTSSAWSVRSFTCDTVEVQTRARLMWPCIPGPHCIPWVQFESRARRTGRANTVLARGHAITNTGLACVHVPATTAWTSWLKCNAGGAAGTVAPSSLDLIGIYMP